MIVIPIGELPWAKNSCVSHPPVYIRCQHQMLLLLQVTRWQVPNLRTSVPTASDLQLG